MKKRILSLLVALCLVVGLLPVIAMAEASTTADIYILDTGSVTGGTNKLYPVIRGADPVYLISKTATATATRTVLSTGTEGNWNIKLEYPDDGKDTVNIYLDNTIICGNSNNNIKPLILGSADNNNFNVNIYVIGTNTFTITKAATNTGIHTTSNNACIFSHLAEGRITTITTLNGHESGILNLVTTTGINNQKCIYSDNDLILKDVTINAAVTTTKTSSIQPTLHVDGNLTIDGGVLNVSHPTYRNAILVDDNNDVAMSSGAGKYTLEIKNGAVVTAEAGNQVIRVDGECIIDNSDVTITSHTSGTDRHVYSKTGGLTAAPAGNCVKVLNATVEQSLAKDGSDPDEIDPATVEGYFYPYTMNGQNYKYFHTTPITSGGEETDPIEVLANMQLNANMNFNFYVPAADVADYTTLTATITHTYADDTPDDVQTVTGSAYGDYIRFEYANIAAKEMMDTLSIAVYADGGAEPIVTDEDSVYDYIDRTSADPETEAKWLPLFAALLNYGAGAQDLFDYNEGNFANTTMPAALTTANAELANIAAADGTHTVPAEGLYKGMSLQWGNSIAVAMVFDGLEDGMYAEFTVDGDAAGTVNTISTLEGGYKCFLFTGVDYADAEKDIVVTVYNADASVYATATDSMESYITRSSTVTGIDAFWHVCACAKTSFA